MKYFLVFLVCTGLWSCVPTTVPVVSLSGKTMGTTYSVKYVNNDTASTSVSPDEMHNKIDKVLLHVNQLMSTYLSDSELSLLNQTKENIPFPISEETNYVLQEAIRLNKLSAGMLDVTVGPLVNLWGFGPTKRPDQVPTQAQLLETMKFVGIDKFTLNNREVVKHHPNVYIDLSTIAKGYGVDEVAELLISEGLSDFLVEIGGEMRVAGHKSKDVNWLIAIEQPTPEKRSIQRIVSIGDNAIATSGDYRNYFEEDNIRYSHLINPSTGFPIKHNLVAVTVVAKKSIEADGLATALIVMGSENGIALAEKNNIAALFITKEDSGFVEYQTTKFRQIVEVK